MNGGQLKIAICDDEKHMRQQLSKVLEFQFKRKNVDINLVTYDSGVGLLADDTYYDLLFLDIEMPEMDGLQTAKKIRENYNEETKIVFLTSHIENARRAYQVNAHRFLVKDNYEEELEECIDSILNIKEHKAKYKVNNNGNIIEISEDDIFYISSTHNGSEIWLKNSVCKSEKFLTEWEKELDSNLFVRTHISYIVNVSKIDFIKENIVLYSGDKIIFSRRNKTKIMRMYTQYMYNCGRS